MCCWSLLCCWKKKSEVQSNNLNVTHGSIGDLFPNVSIFKFLIF